MKESICVTGGRLFSGDTAMPDERHDDSLKRVSILIGSAAEAAIASWNEYAELDWAKGDWWYQRGIVDYVKVRESQDIGQHLSPLLGRADRESVTQEVEDLLVERERLKAQLRQHRLESAEAKRRAEQADERAGELLNLASRLEAANSDMQQALEARQTGKLCLHDKNEGYVSRRLDNDQVAIEFETSDGRVVEQVHHRDQFIDGKLPQEGDRMEAHVLAWFHPPEPADASQYLTPEELKHGFPGFQKAIERRRREEQEDQS